MLLLANYKKCKLRKRKLCDMRLGSLGFEPTLFGGYMFVMTSKTIFTGKVGFESLPRRHSYNPVLSLFQQKGLDCALLELLLQLTST
jgi:hypothetical protein